MDHRDIRKQFEYLALEVFGLSLDTYLATNQNRLLFGYAIDLPARSFFPIFGDPPVELTKAMDGRFVDSIAGYKVAVQTVFPIPNLNADVLLLSTELDSVSNSDLDTILIHEICHLVIDSNFINQISLRIDEKSRYHGDRLYKKTDRENERITKHDIRFCHLLSAAADKYSSSSEILPSRWDVLNSAMRYDLAHNARAWGLGSNGT